MALKTEFAFTLPRGFLAADGSVHRRGVMRLATARDEIEPLRDPRVQGADDPFLTIIVLSRVITELGTLQAVTPREIENLFAADLAFLQDLYGVVNFGSPNDIAVFLAEAEAAIEPESASSRSGRNGSAKNGVAKNGTAKKSSKAAPSSKSKKKPVVVEEDEYEDDEDDDIAEAELVDDEYDDDDDDDDGNEYEDDDMPIMAGRRRGGAVIEEVTKDS
jgi:hypothetical protein